MATSRQWKSLGPSVKINRFIIHVYIAIFRNGCENCKFFVHNFFYLVHSCDKLQLIQKVSMHAIVALIHISSEPTCLGSHHIVVIAKVFCYFFTVGTCIACSVVALIYVLFYLSPCCLLSCDSRSHLPSRRPSCTFVT